MTAFLARTRRGAIAKAFLAFAGITGVASIALISMPASTRNVVLAPAIAAAQSLSSIIGNRSPGTRAEGALAKSKKRLATPRKRLAKRVPKLPDTMVRRRLAPRGPEPVRLFDEELFSSKGPLDTYPVPDLAFADTLGAPFTVPNPSGGPPFVLITSSSGGGSSGGSASSGGSSGGVSSSGGSTGSTGGGSTGSSTGGISSTSGGGSGSTGSTGGSSSSGGTPQAPVPEPGTWLMMLAGFGMIGAALRRRPRAVRPTN